MATNIIDGDLRVNGNVQITASGGKWKPDIPRANLEQESYAKFPVLLNSFFVWDSGQPLPAAGATDDIGLYPGTFATSCPVLSSGDVKNSTTTRYARVLVKLPECFDDTNDIKLRISAATKTTIASSSSTVDVEAYLVGRDSLISGSDLCTTSATSINSTTFADKDFTITGAARSKGDTLDIRITLACVDSATATAVTPTIADVELLCDIRG
jgi:hypothetical protein